MDDNLKCLRCGKEWVPRNKDKVPGTCPRCCSPYWNKPRKNREAVVTVEALDVESVEASRYTCRIKGCSHVWLSRIKTLPLVCPKCHSKNWNSGITPVDARAYLSRMSSAVCGPVSEFAKTIGMDAAALSVHLKGEPMTLSMLQSIEGILKAKGYSFLGLEEHAARSAELEAITLAAKGDNPPLAVWERFLGDHLKQLNKGDGEP